MKFFKWCYINFDYDYTVVNVVVYVKYVAFVEIGAGDNRKYTALP